MNPLKIISFASKNPARRQELKAGIDGLGSSRPLQLVFADTEADVIREVTDADVLFCHSFTPEMLKAATRLKWIQRTDAGVEKTLFPELVEREIIVTNTRGIHGRHMAEWTLGAILYLAQRFDQAEIWKRQREWRTPKRAMAASRFQILNRRALILGYGEIGRPVVDLLSGAGLRCEAVAARVREAPIPIHTLDSLPEIIGRFDVVVVVLPLTRWTEDLFDEGLLSKMKTGSILVNLARGGIVDEAALIRALREGRPVSAALDVFREEPLPENSPLFSVPNLFMSPHSSGNFSEYTVQAQELFLDNLGRYLRGEPLRYVVDKRRGY